MFQTNVVAEIKTHFVISNFFFEKLTVPYNVENIVKPGRPSDNMAHVH